MCPLSVNPASFVGRSRADLLQRLEERLITLTDYTYLGDGSVVRSILEAFAYEGANIYSILNHTYNQTLVTEATGLNLDALGTIYNVTRRSVSAVATQGAFYFYLATSPNHQTGIPTDTADEQFIIPGGTIVRTRDDAVGDAYRFETTASVTFEIGDSVHYATIRPSEGTLRTNIAPHTLRVHNYDGTGSTNLYCTNPVELNSDTSAEPDEELRARIIAAIRSIASSNKLALRMAALSVSHVRDAKVIERIYGPATARVVIAVDYGAFGNELSLVTDAVEEARPVGTLVEVAEAKEYGISIKYGMVVENETDRQSMEQSITSAIRSYVGSMRIGQPFRKSQLQEKMFLAAPTALDIAITGISVNGSNFVGDTYQISEDAIFTVTGISPAS